MLLWLCVLRQVHRQLISSPSCTPPSPIHRIPARFLQSLGSTTQPGLGLIRPDLTCSGGSTCGALTPRTERRLLSIHFSPHFAYLYKYIPGSPVYSQPSTQLPSQPATLRRRTRVTRNSNTTNVNIDEIVHEPSQLNHLERFGTPCNSGTATFCWPTVLRNPLVLSRSRAHTFCV